MRSNVLIPLILLVSACSARETTLPAGGSASGAGPDSGPNYDPSVITVPFLVDDHFIPSGCMGDCVQSVVIDDVCTDRGPADPQGECHHFLYSVNTAPGALGWAGVLWQTVEQNWGSQSGRVVAPGATTMHFWARTTGANAALTILVGGMDAADTGKTCATDTDCASEQCMNSACTAPHHDTLNLSTSKTFAANWQEFDIAFPARSYGPEVMSGFGWTAVMPPATSSIEFYVDDLRWE